MISDFVLQIARRRRLDSPDVYTYIPCIPANEWDSFGELFQSMLSAAEHSLFTGELNCGAYIDLPWVDNLSTILKQHDHIEIIKDKKSILRSVDLLLLTLLRSHYAGLVTGKDVRSKLASCLDNLRLDLDGALAVEDILESSILLRECLEPGGQSRTSEGLAEENRNMREIGSEMMTSPKAQIE